MEITSAMLADAARVERAKLYIHGGGWDRLAAPKFPTTQPSMALVLIARVEYDEAGIEYPLSIELLDEDDRAVGPTVNGKIRTQRAEGARPGAPTFVPQALTFALLRFETPGGYRFRVSCEGSELASVPFELREIPAPDAQA